MPHTSEIEREREADRREARENRLHHARAKERGRRRVPSRPRAAARRATRQPEPRSPPHDGAGASSTPTAMTPAQTPLGRSVPASAVAHSSPDPLLPWRLAKSRPPLMHFVARRTPCARMRPLAAAAPPTRNDSWASSPFHAYRPRSHVARLPPRQPRRRRPFHPHACPCRTLGHRLRPPAHTHTHTHRRSGHPILATCTTGHSRTDARVLGSAETEPGACSQQPSPRPRPRPRHPRHPAR